MNVSKKEKFKVDTEIHFNTEVCKILKIHKEHMSD